MQRSMVRHALKSYSPTGFDVYTGTGGGYGIPDEGGGGADDVCQSVFGQRLKGCIARRARMHLACTF